MGAHVSRETLCSDVNRAPRNHVVTDEATGVRDGAVLEALIVALKRQLNQPWRTRIACPHRLVVGPHLVRQELTIVLD